MKRILRAILSMTLVLVLGFGTIALLTGLTNNDSTNTASQETATEKNDPLIFSDTVSAEDCLPGEIFNAEQSICYYDCNSDEECVKLESELDSQIEEMYITSTELPAPSDGMEKTNTVSYTVADAKITPVLAGTSIAQPDQEVWDTFLKIAPAAFIEENIIRYETYRNSNDTTIAHVDQDDTRPDVWNLSVNIARTHPGGILERSRAIAALIHELAHVLTLDDEQVEPSLWNQDGADECENFVTSEGCSEADSYINAFYTSFWREIYSQSPASRPDATMKQKTEFYETNTEMFLSEAAAISPEEDIAESFTAFVLRPKPESLKVRDKKTNFFYEYPELVSLRSQIRNRIR